MGFPSVTYGIIIPKPIDDLLDIWAYVKLTFKVALFYLGWLDLTSLYPPSEDHYPIIQLPGTPSQSSPSIRPELIKKSLPIVEFSNSASRSADDDEDESVCTVCLSNLEGGHEIRELYNCSHLFHVDCLDKWVDQGNTTCPLCRSKLLPEGNGREGCRDPWIVERISYFFGDDLLEDLN